MTAYSYLAALVLAVVTPLCGTAAIIGSLFDKTGNGPHRAARLWARALLRASMVRVHVVGAENLEPGGTYVFAANHSSAYDILALLAHLPVQFRWLAKEELFRIPFFGRAMRAVGYIPINRSNPREGVKSLERAAERIRAGVSVIIFPEGTRTRDGVIQDFKRGGFTLATRSERPIVPVSISGAHRVLATKTLALHPGPIRIVIDRPISTAGLDREAQYRLVDQVRQVVIANHDPDFGAVRTSKGASDA
ncbi:MAG: 1-acyl-sn-glycerol-3-phosphate acyltransferase [Proteobacteria bacterium]|nr:1-acyl-sn-glycerol-3-phosphate acyltransferase [Pseudomonadota bacterium]